MMPKFKVCLTVDCTESVAVTVEADSRDEAVEKAKAEDIEGNLNWEVDDLSHGNIYTSWVEDEEGNEV